MVDTTNYIESSFVGVNADWIGKVIVLIDEAVFTDSTKFPGKKQLIGNVQCEGRNYKLNINKLNAKRLSQFWGGDTKSWVGKPMIVNSASQVISGEVKQTLILTPQQK